jgi:hypothetical protein
MFVISEVVVDERIAHQHFACDVAKCKGACCTLPGGRGAPLEDDELNELERAFPVVRKYLSERHLRTIERSGLYEGRPGNFTTTCVDAEACAFVYYEDAIARCSLEKAFHEGEIHWRKPISCHLFPVRIAREGTSSVRYEEISECEPALVRGKVEQVPLYDFLKDALIRKFGGSWYEEFRKECRRRDGQQRAADLE